MPVYSSDGQRRLVHFDSLREYPVEVEAFDPALVQTRLVDRRAQFDPDPDDTQQLVEEWFARLRRRVPYPRWYEELHGLVDHWEAEGCRLPNNYVRQLENWIRECQVIAVGRAERRVVRTPPRQTSIEHGQAPMKPSPSGQHSETPLQEVGHSNETRLTIVRFRRRHYDTGVDGRSWWEYRDRAVVVGSSQATPTAPIDWEFDSYVEPSPEILQLMALAGHDLAKQREIAILLNEAWDCSVHPNVPILGHFFPTLGSQCARWGDKLNSSLADKPILVFGQYVRITPVVLRYPGRGGPEHFVLLVTVEGSHGVLGIDNGSFGAGDRVFDPQQVIRDERWPSVTRDDLSRAMKKLDTSMLQE